MLCQSSYNSLTIIRRRSTRRGADVTGERYSEMQEKLIEQDVIMAFGSSIIEFEAVLFQKFLIISAAHSLVSEKMFRRILNDMHAKGFISPTELNHKQCWKRQVVAEDLESEEISPEEFEGVFREKDMLMPTIGSRPVVGKAMVSDSSVVAEEIRKAMTVNLYPGKSHDLSTQKDMQRQATEMRRALSHSSEKFLEYVKRNVPELLEPMQAILREKGEDVMLLGLRIVATT